MYYIYFIFYLYVYTIFTKKKSKQSNINKKTPQFNYNSSNILMYFEIIIILYYIVTPLLYFITKIKLNKETDAGEAIVK